MLELTLEGECHNGRRPARVDAGHWRFETRGDTAHYSYYFHCTLTAGEPGPAVVDVAPDADLLPGSRDSFERHRPEWVWVGRGADWTRHPAAPDAPEGCLRVRLELEAGETVRLSRMRPFPLSAIRAREEALAAHPEARAVSLGESAEGRELGGLEIGEGARRVLILAGQHPAEFGGSQAVLGIADWLLSRVPEAEALRAGFTFLLLPCVNPDGNAQGRCGANARGEDLYRAFEGASAGAKPQAPEAACVWNRVWARAPALTLNFHSYTGPSRGGDAPWEGLYTAPDEAFASTRTRERQRRLDDLLAWETDGLSQHGRFSRHAEGSLEYQLAGIGVLNAFYELQDAAGPVPQRRTGVHVLRTALRALEEG